MKIRPFFAVSAAFLVVDASARSEEIATNPPDVASSRSSLHEAPEVRLLGLTNGNRLVRFSSAEPARLTVVELEGVSGQVLGIDWRPSDRNLYAVNSTQDLYRVDPVSGVATLVSSLTVGFEGSPNNGFDFNPQADRLRLIAETGQNLRVHVSLGAVAVDGSLAFAPGDPHAGSRPRIAACAYTNNRAEAPTTRLFDIDWELDVLALQEPPNDGELQTVGPLGADFGPLSGFDIVTREDGSELAFAASGGMLYRIDLETGAATSLGSIGEEREALLGLVVLP